MHRTPKTATGGGSGQDNRRGDDTMAAKLMMRTTVVVVLATGLVVAAPASKPTHTPVTVTIADTQNGYPLRVGSDTQGAYVEIRRTTTSAIERYSTGTDWMLNTYYIGAQQTPSNRSVFFDLREPASLTNPAPPFATGYAQAHLIAKCRLINVDLFALALGAHADCPGSFRFQAAGTGLWYRLSFNPSNFPEVNRLRVRCTASDDGGCKMWTIAPSGASLTGSDPNVKNVTRLLQVEDYTEEYVADLGNYYVSFLFTVVR